MLLYNVTVGVDKDIETEWLEWMKEKHIPDVMKTGMFESSKIYKVLNDQDLEVFAPVLTEEHRKRFVNNVAFRTLLEEI
jgi:hypothetical protein